MSRTISILSAASICLSTISVVSAAATCDFATLLNRATYDRDAFFEMCRYQPCAGSQICTSTRNAKCHRSPRPNPSCSIHPLYWYQSCRSNERYVGHEDGNCSQLGTARILCRDNKCFERATQQFQCTLPPPKYVEIGPNVIRGLYHNFDGQGEIIDYCNSYGLPVDRIDWHGTYAATGYCGQTPEGTNLPCPAPHIRLNRAFEVCWNGRCASNQSATSGQEHYDLSRYYCESNNAEYGYHETTGAYRQTLTIYCKVTQCPNQDTTQLLSLCNPN